MMQQAPLRRKQKRRGWAPAWAGLLLFAVDAKADGGMPLALVALPLSMAALAPLVLIEGVLFARCWKELSCWKAFVLAGRANVKSVFLGAPAAWAAQAVFQLLFLNVFILFTPPLFSSGEISLLHRAFFEGAMLAGAEANRLWTLPVNLLAFLVPWYFISVWIEGRIVAKALSEEASNLRRAKRVKGVSFTLLGAALLYWAVVGASYYGDLPARCGGGDGKACELLLHAKEEQGDMESARRIAEGACLDHEVVGGCVSAAYHTRVAGRDGEARRFHEAACRLDRGRCLSLAMFLQERTLADEEEVDRLLRIACESPSPPARYYACLLLGRAEEGKGRTNEAVGRYEQACKDGNPDACIAMYAVK